MIKFTLFKSIFDNKTGKAMTFESFDGFEKLLYSLAKKPARKHDKEDRWKKASPLISPATYKDGIDPRTNEPFTRANRNVQNWAGWAALDVDDYEVPFEEVIESFKDYYFVCYSTASSTKEHPKFRIVFPLTSDVDNQDIRHFWFALNKEFLGVLDAQTKDLSRMYYIPGQYPNAHNFIFTHQGPILDAQALMDKHEYVPSSNNFLDNLPPQLKEEIMRQRRATLTRDFTWSSFKDCPFVRDELVMEYAAMSDGRYRFLFQMMCSIAGIAVKKGYPITAEELETLVRQIDQRFQKNRFEKRPIIKEANRALEFVYGNM